MSKVAAVGIVLLFGTGCATERAPLQAMLLPPVDGKVALWVNQPAYFAVLGVGPERGAEVLYQQTALEAVPANGYVYVPVHTTGVPAPELIQPDADVHRADRKVSGGRGRMARPDPQWPAGDRARPLGLRSDLGQPASEQQRSGIHDASGERHVYVNGVNARAVDRRVVLA